MEKKWRPLRGGAPLPIPNREVKPRRGDDTAGDRGKVARRPPLTETLHHTTVRGSLFLDLTFVLFKKLFLEVHKTNPLLRTGQGGV